MKEKTSFKRGIFYVFLANFINLCISLCKGFLLPKYLSIEAYADIQTYLLYVSYVGFLHLGYIDGLYLNYGGKNFEDLDSTEFNIARNNTFLFQLLVMLPAFLLSLFLSDLSFLCFAISILPINMTTLYKSIFQATGKFKIYGNVLNIISFFSFLGTLVLLFVFHSELSVMYILVLVFVDYLGWFWLEYQLKRYFKMPYQVVFSISDLVRNIKSGFLLMLGNFSSVIMTGIDRWFVKILLTVNEFAYYSFAVRIENLLTVFITPVVTTMYNYLCRVNEKNQIKKICNYCLLAGLFLIGSAFPLKFILEHFLTKYVDSVQVLFLLFATQSFYLIIKGVYVNLYKARKKQKYYFAQLILVIIVGFFFNLLFYLLWHSNEGIALGTLLSVILWFFLCYINFKQIRFSGKSLFFLFSSIILFLTLGVFTNSVLGFIIYYLYIVLFGFLFMKESIFEIIHIGVSFLNKKAGRNEVKK